MYKKIRSMPTVLQQYCDELIQEGTITREEYEVSKPQIPNSHQHCHILGSLELKSDTRFLSGSLCLVWSKSALI